MKCIFVGLLLITLVAGIKECTPGTQVDAGDGCNTCLCLGKGTVVSCTLRDCSAVEPTKGPKGKPIVEPKKGPEEIPIGEPKKGPEEIPIGEPKKSPEEGS